MAEPSPYVVGVTLPKDVDELMWYLVLMLLIYVTLLTLEKARALMPPLPTLWQVATVILLTLLIVLALTVYDFSSRAMAVVSTVRGGFSELIHPPASSRSWFSLLFPRHSEL